MFEKLFLWGIGYLAMKGIKDGVRLPLSMRSLSSEYIQFLKNAECGFPGVPQTERYYDSLGVATIGYGFTVTVFSSLGMGNSVPEYMSVDEANFIFDKFLSIVKQDMIAYGWGDFPFTQREYEAFFDLWYNTSHKQTWDFYLILKSDSPQKYDVAFRKYDYSNGGLLGLVRRRMAVLFALYRGAYVQDCYAIPANSVLDMRQNYLNGGDFLSDFANLNLPYIGNGFF